MNGDTASNVLACYQCQKCSAGCPVASFMDYKPHQVMQLVNLGMIEKLLSCRTIWVCASCYTCSTRCPNDVNVAEMMDWLRQRSLQARVAPAEKDVALFHRTFLEAIRARGRVHELSMIARYKMATRRYFDDMKLGWKMFVRGKLKLLPSGVRNRTEIDDLFAGRSR
jgi:heterodisulfide reductase subunit C